MQTGAGSVSCGSVRAVVKSTGDDLMADVRPLGRSE